ncbi:MAG TPA: acyl-CoA-binding protein [Deltaproteobacteria bacterium]|nr:acyl-CoA-binding protein [Deltaproteobacteria bacterium]
MSDELAARFTEAQEQVKTLTTRPSNEDLLQLYALFKQGTVGDVQGKRPGMMDFKGRAKHDAWAGKKGMTQAEAQEGYVALVARLLGG